MILGIIAGVCLVIPMVKALFSNSDSSPTLPEPGFRPTCTRCRDLGRLCWSCADQVVQVTYRTTLKGYDPKQDTNWESSNQIEIDN